VPYTRAAIIFKTRSPVTGLLVGFEVGGSNLASECANGTRLSDGQNGSPLPSPSVKRAVPNLN